MALRKFLFRTAAEGYAEEQAAVDDIELGRLTLSGLSGVSLVGGASRATSFADPTAAQDLATKAYVDAVASGLTDFKESVRAATTVNIALTGLQTVDGVVLAAPDRVLVKNQTVPAENGLYNVSATAWTRSVDADVSAEVTAGAFVFVEEGALNADTGWVLATNNPIVLGTTGLSFTKFTSSSDVTAGAGLLRVAADLSVELDVAAGGQTVGADGGSSGLEFDATGIAGKIRAAVTPTGGLERATGGLRVRLNGATLVSAAAGLSVGGLPSLFSINGVATSASVTAANVNTLVGAGNADTLHAHEDVVALRVASGAIAKGDGVFYSANDVVSTGDCTVDTKSRIIGVADAAIATTVAGRIKRSGVVTAVLSGAVANTRYFLGSTGQPVLIAAIPAGGRTIQLGIAKNATDLEVSVFDFGKRAA